MKIRYFVNGELSRISDGHPKKVGDVVILGQGGASAAARKAGKDIPKGANRYSVEAAVWRCPPDGVEMQDVRLVPAVAPKPDDEPADEAP